MHAVEAGLVARHPVFKRGVADLDNRRSTASSKGRPTRFCRLLRTSSCQRQASIIGSSVRDPVIADAGVPRTARTAEMRTLQRCDCDQDEWPVCTVSSTEVFRLPHIATVRAGRDIGRSWARSGHPPDFVGRLQRGPSRRLSFSCEWLLSAVRDRRDRRLPGSTSFPLTRPRGELCFGRVAPAQTSQPGFRWPFC